MTYPIRVPVIHLRAVFPGHSFGVLVFCRMDGIKESLSGCFAEAILTGVRSCSVVVLHSLIQIKLQLLNRMIYFLAESNSVKLVLDGSVQSLAYTGKNGKSDHLKTAEDELLNAPELVKQLLESVPVKYKTRLELTEESINLADFR